jgi:putative transposase
MASDRMIAIELIEEATAAGARRHRACAVLNITLRTVQRWQKALCQSGDAADQRKAAAQSRTPANKLSEAERQQILSVCNQEKYQSLPPSQIVPQLADEGRYIASESSFYRVLRAASQSHRRGRALAPRTVAKPAAFIATAPNEVWSWDITFLASEVRGLFFKLYLIVDIFSRYVVGWEVHESESGELAKALVRKACLAQGIGERGIVLHSDNGSPMKSATLLCTLQNLGVVPSFSRPSVSDDNPYSESLFRTLKYASIYPGKPFESLAAARQWVHRFVKWYNNLHRHSAIGFVTPSQRHSGQDRDILGQRQTVYQQAKQQHPERWSGATRNWQRVNEVWLNPGIEHRAAKPQIRRAA